MRLVCQLLALSLLFAASVRAAPEGAAHWGKTIRSLKVDDRSRRRAALTRLANGEIEPNGKREIAAGQRALGRFLSLKRPGLERALAVRALGRLGDRKTFEKLLQHLVKDTDDRVLAAAAEAFRLAPASSVPTVMMRLDAAKAPETRAVLIRLLSAMGGDPVRKRMLLRARGWDHWCPRAAALHGLARDKSKESLALLVESLDTEDPALLTAAVESLTTITKKKFGLDVAKWKAWWATRDLPEDEPLVPAPGEAGRTVAQKPNERRTIAPRYFSIPITGSRVVFVYDVSASMRYKLPLANDQLLRAVKALPSTTRFEVVFFNEHVYPWRDRLSWADPVTKLRLAQTISDIEIKSYTNLYDSMERAFRLDPDEIFIISDGAPNRGRFRLPRDIIREVKKLNEKRIPIHSISIVRVVDGDEHIALLETIAKQNGGQHVQRTLK